MTAPKPKMSEVFELPLTAERDEDGWLVIRDAEENTLTVDPIGGESTIRAINAHDPLVEAIKRQCANIDHWLETGEAASPEESKSIYDQMVAALALAEGRS